MQNEVSGASGQTGVERREAPRVDLEGAQAKVITGSGEYLCLMRDLSTLGIGLGFLHKAPADERMILQLENGHTFPIEKVWLGKKQAGYRFACEVRFADFTSGAGSHQARATRLNIGADAEIVDGKVDFKVRLINLSREGAQFESSAHFSTERLIGFRMEQAPHLLGEIRWHESGRYGMRFQHPLTQQELADASLALQPLPERVPASDKSENTKRFAA